MPPCKELQSSVFNIQVKSNYVMCFRVMGYFPTCKHSESYAR
jgi:hypothetical protein